MSNMRSHSGNDDSFDLAMRQRWLDAAQQLSPATSARLRSDRHAAARGERMPLRGWALGAVSGGVAAAVFAIAFGLDFNARRQLDELPAQAGDMIATVEDAPGVSALDQDPDFYAWLASPDAQLVAME